MNTTRATFRLFWQHVRRYPLVLAGLAISLPVGVFATEFLAPLIGAEILNRIAAQQFTRGELWDSFGPELVWYSIIVLIGFTLPWRAVVYFDWTLEARVLRDLSQRVFDHLLAQSANFHASNFGGSLVSQATKLNSAYVRVADTTIFSTAPLMLAVLFTSVILWPRAPLFVPILLVLCAIFLIVTVLATKGLHTYTTAEAQAENRQTGYLADSITNVLAIKSFAASDVERARFAKATEHTRIRTANLMRKTLLNEISFSSIYALIAASAMAIAVTGVVKWDVEVGTVFLVLAYSASIGQRLWDFSIESLRSYIRALGDAQDMVKILHTEPSVKDSVAPIKARVNGGGVSFREVCFTHHGNNRPLFDHFDLSIAAGEKVGLVGHSGSGKTTLVTLLLRFTDINAGEILIDGQNIAQLVQNDLRRLITYVPQEPLLFHRSIRENISYGRSEASDEQIIRAAEKAHAADFIEMLPDGYDTLVGERGVKLSGGQRQRIAIARAMLKQAPVLLLDEATSALDSQSERYIQQALAELMTDRTTLVIAHRLSTIQRMDRIVVLDKGEIAEQGTHQELLAAQGAYAELWAHQSGGFLQE